MRKYKISPGEKVRLSEVATAPGKLHDEEELREKLAACVEEISALQYRLYAENRRSLLIILQGMDSSGKDGTIKHLMRGLNPQGTQVHSFKHPTDLELEHDFLWRHIQKIPQHGEIAIFNRSHYENVLICKVHPELVLAERRPGIDTVKKVDKKFWKERYEQINGFEKGLVRNGIEIVKFFLHLSFDEQRDRFFARLDNKEKHWKFSAADITERGFWPEYQKAYEQALEHTSTKKAPWYVIPADHKPFTHLQVARIVLEKLRKMDPQFPPEDKKETALLQKARKQLKQGM
ncbi:PPK2 family polyphosphate kinase [Nemorincola caseinilytica]|uniref:PPK2 family polyphosphate kinase n=1 Tax=Nemorincola caseinilytica TaxID=2054315 RepID=UPI0031EE1CDD